jgi:hypothetical protein
MRTFFVFFKKFFLNRKKNKKKIRAKKNFFKIMKKVRMFFLHEILHEFNYMF